MSSPSSPLYRRLQLRSAPRRSSPLTGRSYNKQIIEYERAKKEQAEKEQASKVVPSLDKPQ